jgi:hypothetical protein
MSKEVFDQLLKKIEAMTTDEKVDLLQDLLNSLIGVEPPKIKSVVKTESAVIQKQQKDLPDFSMRKSQKQERSTADTPVNLTPKFNKFEDDGDHRDEENSTPEVEITPRSRPKFKKVAQECYKCNSSTLIHPSFVRDFYVCDKCSRR